MRGTSILASAHSIQRQTPTKAPRHREALISILSVANALVYLEHYPILRRLEKTGWSGFVIGMMRSSVTLVASLFRRHWVQRKH